MPTKDGVPQIEMTEAQLSHLNDTMEYMNELPGAPVDGAASKGAKPKAKGKAKAKAQAVGEPAAPTGRLGVNKLDLIEFGIAQIYKTLAENKFEVKVDVISLVRRRLLEFVFRGGKAEVANGKKAKKLSDIQGAVAHFHTAAWEMHKASGSCDMCQYSAPADGPGDANDQDDLTEDDSTVIAFGLPLSADVMRQIESGR